MSKILLFILLIFIKYKSYITVMKLTHLRDN